MSQAQQSTWPIGSAPGVKRDGTAFDGKSYVDAVWCRFQRGKPRKMGGYRQAYAECTGISRGCYPFAHDGFVDVYNGHSAGVEFTSLDSNGFGGALYDRTPAGFTAQTDYLWQFDAMYDAGSSQTIILAHPGRNLVNIDNTTATPVYYGALPGNTQLTSIGQSVSGGLVVLHPFLFLYDSYGNIKWSDTNGPTNFGSGAAGSARVTATKIVKGLPVRGSSISGVFWSLDSVIRATFQGTPTTFKFETVTSQSSVLSSQAIIEYDGQFFWPGVDRFLVYNGVVREVPNDMNLNFFYDNLNWEHRQKVWALKIPRFGEIWWFFPKGNSTECNHAVVLNVREGTWYDTPIDRSSGAFSQVFRYPLMFGTELTDGNTSLWQHEFGVDEIKNNQIRAIRSYFETADMSWCDGGPGQSEGWMGLNYFVELNRIEPDFVQSGNMSVTVRGREFANGPEQDSDPVYFSPGTTHLDFSEQRRQMRLRFESNTEGGNYQMGQTIAHLSFGDTR